MVQVHTNSEFRKHARKAVEHMQAMLDIWNKDEYASEYNKYPLDMSFDEFICEFEVFTEEQK